jgi:hypothetical protein
MPYWMVMAALPTEPAGAADVLAVVVVASVAVLVTWLLAAVAVEAVRLELDASVPAAVTADVTLLAAGWLA